MAIVTLRGQVVDPQHSRPGATRVEVWDTAIREGNRLATTDAEQNGDFKVDVELAATHEGSIEWARTLQFRVYRDEIPLTIASGAEIELKFSKPPHIRIELASREHLRELVITGQVKNLGGAALADLAVLALRLMIQDRQLEIGRGTTNADGSYSICCRDMTPASPTVIVVTANGSELRRSDLICDRSGRVRCDLVIENSSYQSPPEFVELTQALEPLIGKVPVRTLSDGDLAILKCAAEQPMVRLQALRTAAQIVEGTSIPLGAVYGLLREGSVSDRGSLLSQSSQVLTNRLDAAIAARIAPALTPEEVSAAVEAMANLRVTDILSPQGQAGLSKLLAFAVADEPIQAAIVSAYMGFQGDADTFWSETLAHVDGLSDVAVRARVELVAGIGALTFGHPPLVGALLSKNAPIAIGSLRDLARLQVSDWKGLLTSSFNGALVGVPTGVPGATDEERVDSFAQDIAQTVAARLPTATLAASLGRTQNKALVDAGSLLNTQPNFELAGASITKQFPLAANPTAAQIAAHNALTKLQRLYKLTPNASEVIGLWNAGLGSSVAIARLTPQDLAAAAALPVERAQQLTALAASRVNTVLSVIGKYGRQTVGAAIPAIPTFGSVANANAEQTEMLQDLWGPESLCTCEEFRSLDGYWAYFASLLFFLSGSAQYELLSRRPDLGGLRFSRANAETDDRYLSLSLEVLESAVLLRESQLGGAAFAWPSYQTTWTSDQLAAAPENTNLLAYGLLAAPSAHPDIVYPTTLPFDFYAEQARAFEGLLGVTRGDLMEALQNRSNPAAPSPTQVQMAQEWLGAPAAAWSLLKDTTNPSPQSAGLVPTNVQDFLDLMGIKSPELVALLNCRFINPPAIAFADRVGVQLDDTCSATLASLTGNPPPDASFLGRTSRFIRLWRALSWPMRDVDLAIWQFTPATLDEQGVTQISNLKRLRQDVGLPLTELLVWWADIDTLQDTDQPSQLAALFPSLQLPAPWPLNTSQPAILSGLGLTAEDLARLNPPDPIDLSQLSLLYRKASMARWLGVDIESFLALCELIDVKPFASVDETRHFLRITTRLRACAFSLTELRYLLGGDVADDAPAGFVVTDDRANDFATQLRGVLLPITLPPPADPTYAAILTKRHDTVVAKLAAWLSVAPAVAASLLGPPFPSPAGAASPLDYLTSTLTDNGYWPTNPAAIGDLQGLLTQLSRQALLTTRLALTGDEVDSLVQAKQAGWLDITSLPISLSAPASFESLEPWLTYRTLSNAQPPFSPPLLGFLTGPAPGAWGDVAGLFGWNADAVSSIATTIGSNAPAGLQDILVLGRLNRALRMLSRASLTPATASGWVAGSAGTDAVSYAAWAATANDVVSAARACVGEQNWSAAAQPLRNALLTRQRDALLAYLWGAGLSGDQANTFPDSDDVRDRYLVDPMMGPEFTTTRLELALQSIQLFTDRCFRNQEAPITLSEAQAEQWKNYQGKYRYWQAAVDIWLAPHAYVDFGFLDRSNDRYTAFAQALTQRNLTKDTVADALAAYLHAVADAANLEICGYYEDYDNGGSDNTANRPPTLHVVGRTKATPATYYYTYRDGANWAPWQKISADINAGDNAVMVAVFHRRLFVIWPIITIKADDPSGNVQVPAAGGSAPISPPSQHPEFQIGWTVLKNGSWSAKQISDSILPTDWVSQDYPSVPDTIPMVFRAGVVPSIDDPNQEQLRVSLTLWPYGHGPDPDGMAGSYSGEPEFGFTSCLAAPVIHNQGVASSNFWPLPSTVSWNGFLLSQDDPRYIGGDPTIAVDGLTVVTGFAPDLPNEGQAWPDPPGTRQQAFWAAPTSYQVLFSAQYAQPIGQSFFFQDDRWSFFAQYRQIELGPIVTFPIITTVYPIGRVTNTTSVAAAAASSSIAASVRATDPATTALAQSSLFTQLQVARAANQPLAWIPPNWILPIWNANAPYRFYTFCHPTVCDFLEALDANGLSGLLRRDPSAPIQAPTPPQPEFFNARYDSNPTVVDNFDLPNPGVEFTGINPYGQDNQNIFYYCVGAAASALTATGQFDDAEWFWRSIFDPMDGSADPSPQRYWKYEPLRVGYQDTLGYLYGLLSADPDTVASALAEVQAWNADPFDPWAVASSRPIALMKIAVRFFLTNWLTQADQLYAQAADQETLMRAADGYIRSLEILGPEPQPIEPARSAVESPDDYYCFNDISSHSPADASLPEIIESALPPIQSPLTNSTTLPADRFPWSTAVNITSAPDKATGTPSLLFCIPRDTCFDQLRQWATTKLNNIRAGLDFNGQPHVYSVYGARIDPALLARAAAAGIDLDSTLSAVSAPPRYLRFPVLLQRAKEFVSELKGISASLLGALTEDSAESLAELRASQEVSLLNATLTVKQQAQAEAQCTLDSLLAYQAVLQAKYQYYSSRQMISPGEAAALGLTQTATILQTVAGAIGATAGVITAIPDFVAGVAGIGGSPTATVSEGGSNIGGALSAVSRGYEVEATLLHAQAGAIGTVASYQRRMDDWQMLANTTQLELSQVKSQIAAQQARLAAATADLTAFQLQQANAEAVRSYMDARVNNVQFRGYRISQLSSVAHQGYLLAFSLAKAAEAAYQFERYPRPANYQGTDQPPSFIQFGYWQNNYNGTTAAEQLGNALQQLEFAYSTVDPGDKPWPVVALSLAMIAPSALESLRRTGNSGVFPISELQFLRIRPDAYFLRIRHLKVRIPNVTGPYTPVMFKVEMVSQGLRLSGESYSDPTTPGNALAQPIIDANYATMYTTGRVDEPEPQTVADGQYRPFEGFGAAESQFRISFPEAMATLYGASIADVIFEFELTAREATPAFAYGAKGSDGAGAGGAVGALANQSLMRLLRLTTDFPNPWYQAINAPPAPTLTVTIPLAADRFPYAGDQQITLTSLAVMAVWKTVPQLAGSWGNAVSVSLGGTPLAIVAAGIDPFASIPAAATAAFDSKNFEIAGDAAPVTLTVTIDSAKLPPEWTTLAPDGVTRTTGIAELVDLVTLINYKAG